MKTFIISYDLSKPETSQEYLSLINMIKSVSNWAKPLESLWLIKSDLQALQIAERIKSVIDPNDKCLVIEVKEDWAVYGVSQTVINWLRSQVAP